MVSRSGLVRVHRVLGVPRAEVLEKEWQEVFSVIGTVDVTGLVALCTTGRIEVWREFHGAAWSGLFAASVVEKVDEAGIELAHHLNKDTKKLLGKMCD